MRIVSLVPSVTETLMAWGLQPVAVTRFCEQPHLPVVGGTKNPDVAGIIALAPDVVILDKEENRAEDASALDAAGIPLHVLHVTSLADVAPSLAGLARLAGATDVELPSLPLAADRLPTDPAAPTAFIPIWRRPWMSINADTYGSSLLAAAGIHNVFAAAKDRYPTVTLNDAAARRPDVVLAPSEPYPFRERHRKELEAVAPVLLIDGRDLFWWGARTADALGRLSTVLSRYRPRPPAG